MYGVVPVVLEVTAELEVPAVCVGPAVHGVPAVCDLLLGHMAHEEHGVMWTTSSEQPPVASFFVVLPGLGREESEHCRSRSR